MKKFTKAALLIAAVAAGIGICCLVGSVANGLTWKELVNMVTDGRFSFGPEDLQELGIGDTQIDESFSNLDVDLGTCELEIYYADVALVEVEQEEISGFRCYVDESTLHVEGGKKIGVNSGNPKVVIRIPQNFSFREFELEVDAGKVTVNGVVANETNIEVGAAKTDIRNLDAKRIEASAGAGELYLEVVGKKENYSYNLECGTGEIWIGDEKFAGLGVEKKITNPNAERFLEADCDIGKVQIGFTE